MPIFRDNNVPSDKNKNKLLSRQFPLIFHVKTTTLMPIFLMIRSKTKYSHAIVTRFFMKKLIVSCQYFVK